jgi:hypothetical protein
MGLMTIGTDYPLMVHATLDEGPEVEHLVLDLTVREVQVGLQQGEPKTLIQRFARTRFLRNTPAP